MSEEGKEQRARQKDLKNGWAWFKIIIYKNKIWAKLPQDIARVSPCVTSPLNGGTWKLFTQPKQAHDSFLSAKTPAMEAHVMHYKHLQRRDGDAEVIRAGSKIFGPEWTPKIGPLYIFQKKKKGSRYPNFFSSINIKFVCI